MSISQSELHKLVKKGKQSDDRHIRMSAFIEDEYMNRLRKEKGVIDYRKINAEIERQVFLDVFPQRNQRIPPGIVGGGMLKGLTKMIGHLWPMSSNPWHAKEKALFGRLNVIFVLVGFTVISTWWNKHEKGTVKNTHKNLRFQQIKEEKKKWKQDPMHGSRMEVAYMPAPPGSEKLPE